MNIFVGNLSYQVTENELREAFESAGQVSSVNLIKDRSTGNSKGFGFIDMPVRDEALSAIEKLDGKSLRGRQIKVNEARPRTSPAPRARW
jgi:RNA recognition motif-containing protein